MTLRDWMRVNGVSDVVMATAIGGISAEGVRKLRFRVRGASIRTASRIDEITGGAVRSPDLVPIKRRTPSVSPEVRP